MIRLLLIWGLLMPTVFDILLHAVRALDVATEGAATSDGTTTTLIDSHLGTAYAGRDDDEFNGGVLFMKDSAYHYTPVQVTNELLDVLAAETSLVVTLANENIVPGSVRFYPPGDLIVDDGDGNLTKAVAKTETFAATLTVTLANVPIEPGSVSLTPISGTLDDDGNGFLFWSNDGRWAGTIDYTTGDVDVSEFGLITGADYNQLTILGTLDYVTGDLSVDFAAAQTGSVYVTYQYQTIVAYVPIIVNVTDFTATSGTVTYEATGTGIETRATDAYAISTRRYPLWLLLQKLNEVLSEIDDYVSTTAVLASAIVNDEYLLADTVRIIRIWEGEAVGDRDWSPVTRYHRVGGVIHFDQSIALTNVLIETVGPAAAVSLTTASISDQYSREWLGLATAVKCCRWRMLQAGADDRLLATQLADLTARERAALWNKVYLPQQKNFSVDSWRVDKWDGN